MPAFKILIVGGGLGGLATSIALGQKGHQVTVLESTAKLTNIGGGIGIPPNSSRVFDHFGILQEIRDAAELSGPTKTCFRRYNGELLSEAAQRSQLYKYESVNHSNPLQNSAIQKMR
jgi:salicylate hydroxylase